MDQIDARPPAISLVLPGYNEQSNIEEAVNRCLGTLRRFTDRPEVLVIDDGSTDATGRLADGIAGREPSVRVIHNPINLGVGLSVLVGMQAAAGDLVVHNAMDYPFDLN